MKLFNVKNIDGLFNTIQDCTGNVNVVLRDKVINLKDDIKTYSNIFSTLSSGSGIEELNLTTENTEDTARLLKFAIRG
ncbi:MAG: hypothetical protein HUJ76_08985 [Parasporobacterium sp.]|nr:hypothetical protein [Parasporobacterium sp.]